jgi:hypothetical protein
MRKFKAMTSAMVVALVLLFAANASACPNCKEAVANQEGVDGVRMQRGYFWSILMMIGMPLGMVSAGTIVVVRAVKRGALPEM